MKSHGDDHTVELENFQFPCTTGNLFTAESWMDNGDMGKLEETTSKYGDLEQQTKEFQFQTQNNTHRLLDMSQEVFFFSDLQSIDT